MRKSAAIKSLRKLRRVEPSVEDNNQLIEELFGETNDRACAIIAASILHDNLIDLFAAHMRRLDDDAYAQIFEGNGPLASFSALIKVGYALHYFDGGMKKHLDTIREIRNAFAHGNRVMTFETPEVRDVCKTLNLFTPAIDYDCTTPKGAFLWHSLKISHAIMRSAVDRRDYEDDFMSDVVKSFAAGLAGKDQTEHE